MNKFLRVATALSVALLALAAPVVAMADDDAPDTLATVKARGTLDVAVYDNFPPYSYKNDKGVPAGVDVDLARALADQLGLQSRVRLFTAGETMNDDLRNNVWRGHYLGGGVADVMLHVAADPQFAAKQDKVAVFGAYFNEAVTVVYRPDRMQAFESPMALSAQKVGVEIDSISDYYLSGAFNGRLRTAAVRHGTLTEAVTAFKDGKVDALMAPRGELQGLMADTDFGAVEFKQQELVGMFRTSWDIGMAVKQADDTLLRDALAQALEALKVEGKLAEIFAAHGVEYVAPGTALAAGTD